MSLSNALRLGRRLTIPGMALAGGQRHPLYAYGRPTFLADFVMAGGWYELSGSRAAGFSSLPSISIARASTGLAQTVAGTLTSFASGAARITDKGLLVEGAATNLLTRSQEFDSVNWAKTACTITANATTAPDGTATADKFIPNVGSVSPWVNHSSSTTVTSGATYTASWYIQRGDFRYFALFELQSGTGAGLVIFDLQTGTVSGAANGATTANGSITALGNGWFRCTYTYVSTGTTNQSRCYISGSGSNITNVTGDGSQGAFIWGAQLEATSFATSYIPTTTASATRAADVISLPVSGLAYPVTMLAEFEIANALATTVGADEFAVQIDNGTQNDRSHLIIVNGTNQGRLVVVTGGVGQATESVAGAVSLGSVIKLAGRAATNDAIAARAGTLSAGDASVTTPASPTNVRFGATVTGVAPLQGYLRRLAIWPTAFSNANLQAVST